MAEPTEALTPTDSPTVDPALNDAADSPTVDEGSFYPDNDFDETTDTSLIKEDGVKDDTLSGADDLDPDKGGEPKPAHEETVPYERLKEKVDAFDALQKDFDAFKTSATEKEAQLMGKIEAMMQQFQKPPEPEAPPEVDEVPDFLDMNTLSPEEILKWHDTNPGQLYDNVFRQMAWQQKGAMKQMFDAFKQELIDMGRTYSTQSMANSFLEENPEFHTMATDGTIKQYLMDNPYLNNNPVAAFREIMANRKIADADAAKDQAIQEAIENFKKEMEQEEANRIKARGGMKVMKSTTRVVPTKGGDDDIMKDTTNHGGPISAAAKLLRLSRRKAASGG